MDLSFCCAYFEIGYSGVTYSTPSYQTKQSIIDKIGNFKNDLIEDFADIFLPTGIKGIASMGL
jgi:hypothetical protein